MDGVTVGHPRCNVPHCTERLASTRDRFCPSHQHLRSKCAVAGCTQDVTEGFRTCPDSAHRAYELERREQGQAIFRLKRRAEKRAAVAISRASAPEEISGEDVLDDVDVMEELELQEVLNSSSTAREDVLDRADVADLLGSTPRVHHSQAKNGSSIPSKTPKMKSAMYRKWTHNEQLMVRCCGIILSRATFFESEGPANALVSHSSLICTVRNLLEADASLQRFVLETFPDHFPRARPSFLFYDNNCHLLAHIRGKGGVGLERIGMPVDVFHASTKHSDRDEFCVNNCNPALFPELYNALNEWIFNSSAAEQVNVWFGKFMSVVREMTEVHYNFFLDEMIMIYNSYREGVLAGRGLRPRLVPVEELQLPL